MRTYLNLQSLDIFGMGPKVCIIFENNTRKWINTHELSFAKNFF